MTTPPIPARLVATDLDGNELDQLGHVPVDLSGFLDQTPTEDRPAVIAALLDESDRTHDTTVAAARDWACGSSEQADRFAATVEGLPAAPVAWIVLDPAGRQRLVDLLSDRPDVDRQHRIDAVKRCYDVSKRVAATIVDDTDHDHPSLPDDIDPEEVEDVISAATGPVEPAEVNVLVRAASNQRLAVTPHRAGPCRIVRADGATVGAISFADLSSWWPNRFDGLGDPQPTGMSAGGGTPMKVARHILRLAKMAPRQHCDACGELLEGPDGCFAPSLARPWCQRCCMSTDVFACETCGKACDADSGHRNNCGYWCDDCHDPGDPDIVCTLHDDACHT